MGSGLKIRSQAKNQTERLNTISKLAISITQGLLGRANLNNLRQQIHIQQKNIALFIKEHRTVKALHLFRRYSALMVVISSALLVSATNLAAGKESSGFLFGSLGSGDNFENPLANKMSLEANKKHDLALVTLSQSSTALDPNAKLDDSNETFILQGQAIVAGTSPVKKDPEEDGGVKIYEVRPGDTVGGIASKFGITVNTILWSNELDNVDSIMPGDKIFILPVAGLNYTVKAGDNLDAIAAKFKADKGKIIAFNDLPADGELKVGEQITIPDGQKEVAAPAAPRTPIATRPYEPFAPSGTILSGRAGAGHKFPYGYCTWYVAQRRYVPWGGNAGTWLYHAKAMGYSTGRTPRPGAIVVTSESWWGHVAIVEKVNGGEITISEMNYKAYAKKDFRVISSASRIIKGYIY
jgi:LysM repeat protein